MLAEVVPGVIASVWSVFEGAPVPKAGMLVDVHVQSGRVLRVVRSTPASDPATARATLIGSLKGLARSMDAQVRKADDEGWDIPAAYTQALAILRAAGETAPTTKPSAPSGERVQPRQHG